MGILGMLLAVPIAVTFYQLLREDIHKDDYHNINRTKKSISELPNNNRCIVMK